MCSPCAVSLHDRKTWRFSSFNQDLYNHRPHRHRQKLNAPVSLPSFKFLKSQAEQPSTSPKDVSFDLSEVCFEGGGTVRSAPYRPGGRFEKTEALPGPEQGGRPASAAACFAFWDSGS
jgi:hypothetical protein